jgi:hypothetical protein
MDHAILPFALMLLLGGHAVADYGLQSAYVAEMKVRTEKNPDWFVTLGAHCLIHGFLVAVVILGIALLDGMQIRQAAGAAGLLAWAEFGIHFAIDHAKGQKRFSYLVDQLLHYGCKLLWLAILIAL